MARGGARANAGRKPLPGSRTLQERARKQAVAEAVALARTEGETPLEYMLRVMRNPAEEDRRRDTMAVAAAPYLHPRLSNATVNVNDKRGVDDLDTDQLIAELERVRSVGRAAAEEESLH
jgi:hypothetical protein